MVFLFENEQFASRAVRLTVSGLNAAAYDNLTTLPAGRTIPGIFPCRTARG